MDANELTGSSNEQNLARILHNAILQADACAGYALKAETAGNKQLATFFGTCRRRTRALLSRQKKCSAMGEKSNLRAVFG